MAVFRHWGLTGAAGGWFPTGCTSSSSASPVLRSTSGPACFGRNQTGRQGGPRGLSSRQRRESGQPAHGGDPRGPGRPFRAENSRRLTRGSWGRRPASSPSGPPDPNRRRNASSAGQMVDQSLDLAMSRQPAGQSSEPSEPNTGCSPACSSPSGCSLRRIVAEAGFRGGPPAATGCFDPPARSTSRIPPPCQCCHAPCLRQGGVRVRAVYRRWDVDWGPLRHRDA